jgi:hypothetical protein
VGARTDEDAEVDEWLAQAMRRAIASGALQAQDEEEEEATQAIEIEFDA